jgi:hypothetical protein
MTSLVRETSATFDSNALRKRNKPQAIASSLGGFDIFAYHRLTGPFARTKQLITCRSQYRIHLLSFVPPPGFAHPPMQFAALFSQCGASVTARACVLRSAPMPIKTIAKKRFHAMCEPPEER